LALIPRPLLPNASLGEGEKIVLKSLSLGRGKQGEGFSNSFLAFIPHTRALSTPDGDIAISEAVVGGTPLNCACARHYIGGRLPICWYNEENYSIRQEKIICSI
jgi:hypothetical protein